MTILEAMETIRQILEGTDAMPREKAVAAYNTIAVAVDMPSHPCVERLQTR